jgi:hypothetical protein
MTDQDQIGIDLGCESDIATMASAVNFHSFLSRLLISIHSCYSILKNRLDADIPLVLKHLVCVYVKRPAPATIVEEIV